MVKNRKLKLNFTKNRIWQTFSLAFLSTLMMLFVNCTGAISTKDDSINSAEGAGKEKAIDAWNAPVGDLVPGALLSDGWYDLRFLPDPVNIPGGWHDSVAVNSDGKSLYFAYSAYDFAAMVETGLFQATGAQRPGMPGNEMKNFRADLTSSGWKVIYVPTNLPTSIYEGGMSANVSQNVLVFARYDITTSKATIYFSEKDTSGAWSSPLPLPTPVNVPNTSNDNPFIIGDLESGIDLYFESDRLLEDGSTGGGPDKHLFHTRYDPLTDSYSAVKKIPGINGAGVGDQDHQPFVTADKKSIYWTLVRAGVEYSLYTADLVSGAYVNARPIVKQNLASPLTGKLNLFGEPNIAETEQGYLLYMICGVAKKETGTLLGAELKICRAKKDKYPAESKKINTDKGWSDSPFISRDGQRLYFMYSRWDFAPWIKSGGTILPQLTGPDRPGLRKNIINPFDESDIYVAEKKADGTWSEPVNLGLNGNYGDASGMEIDDGRTFVWLQGNGVQSQIKIARKNIDGSWGPADSLTSQINLVGSIQDNPHISEDGSGLWFVSDRIGGSGGKDIWFSMNTGSGWSSPVNAGAPFSSGSDDDQFYFSPTTLDIYWNGPMGLMHCVSSGSGCGTPTKIITFAGCDYAAEASLPDDQSRLYFGCGSFATGRVTIMYSEKQAGGAWGPAIPVD